MNNEENILELEIRPTDKKKQAHSNESNKNNSTTNMKNEETYQNKASQLEPKLELNDIIQQTDKEYEDSVSQNVIGSDEKVKMKMIIKLTKM